MIPESRPDRRPLRRTALGPVRVTGVLATLATAAAFTVTAPAHLGTASIAVPPGIVGAGWVLTWLLLGLTAGYGLSGSA